MVNNNIRQFKEHKSTLNIIQFTEEAFFKLFPNKTEEQYLKEIDVDERALVEERENASGKKIDKIRRVIVGDEYIFWLGATRKKDSERTREQYMEAIKDENVTLLWEEQFGTHIVESHFVPVTIVAKEGLYLEPVLSIPEEAAKDFKKGLLELWEDKDVKEEDLVVVPEMMDAAIYGVEEERLLMEAFHHLFSGGPFPTETRIKKGPQSLANIGMRYIPIFIKRENKAILNKEEMRKEYVDHELPEELIKKFTEDLKHQGEEMAYDFIGSPFVIPAFEYQTYYEDFTRGIEEEVERAKKEKGE